VFAPAAGEAAGWFSGVDRLRCGRAVHAPGLGRGGDARRVAVRIRLAGRIGRRTAERPRPAAAPRGASTFVHAAVRMKGVV
jgi:hypothetical protein